jgi:hypothetical protein
MEALSQLANANPGNPSGEPAVNQQLNQELWNAARGVQGAGQSATDAMDQNLGGWPGTIGDYMRDVAATPGVGALIPGAPLAGRGMGNLLNSFEQDVMPKALQPNYMSIMQVLKDRPDLNQWYQGTNDPSQRRMILEYLQRNYTR